MNRASGSGLFFSLSSAAATALINDDFVLLVGIFQLIQVTLHGLAFPNRLGTAHGAELRTVNRHPFAFYQSYLPRHPHQLRPRRSDRLAVHTTELGDGLVIRRQPSQQPHHFPVPPTLSLQPSRRAHLLQVSVQVQLQQIPRIVAGSSRLGRFSSHKTQCRYVQLCHERLNYSTDMIGRNQIVQRRWKQRLLPARFTLNIGHKKCPRSPRGHLPIICLWKPVRVS